MTSNSRKQHFLSTSPQFRKSNSWRVALLTPLLGVFLSASAHAAVFTVNNSADAVDVNPGNGVCETAPGNGVCTLRAAIQEANALAGADEVILPSLPSPNSYLLTIATELGITGNLTITGGGASTTIIDGNKSVRPNGRVLVIGSGITVNINGVTIRNGGTGITGGGIFNGGTLTLTNSTVSGNAAGNDGGGIFNDAGTLTLINSIVSGNNAGVDGGGILNNPEGTLTLTNSTVTGNAAGDDGGGIRNVAGGTLTLTNSTVSGNTAGDDGGGIRNFGTANVFSSTIANNRANLNPSPNNIGGGGLENGGTLTLTDSTVSGNAAGNHAGGILNNPGGTLTLTNSTVSGNAAGNDGGGIFNDASTLTLINSTVTGNAAGDDGGGIRNFGTANVFSSTIANNWAGLDSSRSGIGGGVFSGEGAPFNFQNTIIANNQVGSNPNNIRDCAGTLTSQGYNLIRIAPPGECNVAPVTGDIFFSDPLLGPLQNNGGPTQTHALLSGSPAIDGGNPGGCRDQLGALITTDQRGFRRTVAVCDIGAYELTRIGAEFGEVLTAAPGQSSVLAGGFESSGASRGPAFQLFDSAGTLQTTQFVLNRDFRIDVSFVVGNFDADMTGELLVGGQEKSGLARGPAYQLFDTNGTFKLTRFVLNPDFSGVNFSPLDIGSNGVLACGQEISGLSRGQAYQAFDSSGNLIRTQFVLNPDFTTDNSCIGTNVDGVAGDEVITAGRELTGLGRGPAFQLFGSDGLFRLTRFVLNPDFTETKLTAVDVGGSKNIVVSGRETSGLARGPAYQTFNSIGNFILTRFVLNPDFTDFQLFGANTTNAVSGQEIVTGGTETSGLARGPAIQVWDKNGNHLFTRFVLNPDFTEVNFTKIDINNDGLDEILVVGRESKGLQRGPAFQLFDGNGNLLATQFVLNADFTNLKAFTVDQNGDGDKEIGIGGIEASGLKRGPAYQIFESNGALLQTRFALNPDF